MLVDQELTRLANAKQNNHPFTSMDTPCSGSMRNSNYSGDLQVDLSPLKVTSCEKTIHKHHILILVIKGLIWQTTNPTITRTGSEMANSYHRKAELRDCRHQSQSCSRR